MKECITVKQNLKFQKIFYILFLYLFICSFSAGCIKRRIELSYSYITLKTNNTGYIKILSDKYGFIPDEILINGIEQEELKTEYYLNNSINIAKLIWYNELSSLNSMFSGCDNITEIDLTSFDSSNVVSTSFMFYNCLSLTKIDFSNFDTSNILEMNSMFQNCISLTNLDLSNFATTQVAHMNSMFKGCSSLISLDFTSLSLSQGPFINNLFGGCSKLKYINLKNADITQNLINSNLFASISENLIVCSNELELENIFLFRKKLNCLKDSNRFLDEEDKIICYTNDSNIYNEHICNICGNNFHLKYNDLYNNNTSNNCYESLKDYCPFYYYHNLTSNLFYCTENNNCPNDYKKLISDNNQCIDNCEKNHIYKYDYNNICYDTIFTDITENMIISTDNLVLAKGKIKNETKAEIINNIIKELIKEFNISEIDSEKDKKIYEKDLTIVLTSTMNQKNNEDINNITMNLGQCENILKNYYNLSSNDSLYILQLISEEKGMKIPKIEYQIYYPLFDNKLIKLNLSNCRDTKIEISISVKIDDIIEKYDPNSNYFNDICSKTSSKFGTDISLKDRRNEFVNNNMSLCEENCELIEYNNINEKAKCSCDIKLSIPDNFDIKFNKKDFFKSFININNIANINIMKCFKKVLKLKFLKQNYGFYIISSIIILYFITLIIFIIISFNKLKRDINAIIFASKFNESSVKKYKNMQNKNIVRIYAKKKIKRNKKIKNKKIKAKLNIKNKGNNNFFKDKIKEDNSGHRINPLKEEKVNINNVEMDDKIFNKKDFELNSLDYNAAIVLDNRSYFNYYISLLKYNHPFMFSFSTYEDYNIKIIKIFLFFFSFCSDLTINALFFNDDTMHKIYEEKGKFNLLYQLPQILYSTLISKFIDSLIRKFALSQDNILEFKQIEGELNFEEKHRNLLCALKFKFSLFFVLAFSILIFFWYFLICFCGIYVNTQMHLIKDSLISLLTSLLIPFILSLIPGIFRISSLKIRKKSSVCLYKFSLILENYLG